VDIVSYRSDSSDASKQNYFYDSRKKELLGRTLSSWAKQISFYFLFTSMLALIWGLCMGVFLQTLDYYVPKLITRDKNPGLGFRPAGGLASNIGGSRAKNCVAFNGTGSEVRTCYTKNEDINVYSSLIWFKHGGDGNWQELKANLDNFLIQYEPGYYAGQGSSLTSCNFENDPLARKRQMGERIDASCEFNKEWLSNEAADYKCISEEDYGYRHGKPCILVKMNRIYDWNPDPYSYDEIKNHTYMPKKLVKDITNIWEDKCAPRGYTSSGYTSEGLYKPCPYLNMAWLHCDGEDSPDKENIGPVTYTPFRGFPGFYFPYRNQRAYLSPIVMVQLNSPVPGVIMNIECTVWARNIQHDRVKRRGLTHFELIMD